MIPLMLLKRGRKQGRQALMTPRLYSASVQVLTGTLDPITNPSAYYNSRKSSKRSYMIYHPPEHGSNEEVVSS